MGSIPTPVVPHHRASPAPSEVGAASEAMVLAALLQAGYNVLTPWNRTLRYDLVMETDTGTFARVQCKTGRLQTGGIVFPTTSSYVHRGRGTRGYLAIECDFFGVYCPETRGVYLVPLIITGGRECKLRVTPPKNGQRKGIHLADRYRVA